MPTHRRIPALFQFTKLEDRETITAKLWLKQGDHTAVKLPAITTNNLPEAKAEQWYGTKYKTSLCSKCFCSADDHGLLITNRLGKKGLGKRLAICPETYIFISLDGVISMSSTKFLKRYEPLKVRR
jgi:hypothetical protein